ncbi:uncharacterized protein BDZ99DRAFT_494899 [Mytilinidion resinicola]|uniref:Uncharacterized protein n=1 Tax=Mytilinidion resinicola TaxID=574789 RepID=A0A6A6Z2S7_9PEZI|nr:uncharacterized protein BDZ99DRAFT_494899 [Mytilinidion resinicola]KAF2815039.1 hypothetical protein BDZ99DRAFT_494899 [Mytilinidion resinicola]
MTPRNCLGVLLGGNFNEPMNGFVKREFGRKVIRAKKEREEQLKKDGRAGIDLFALPVATFLHEIMHTYLFDFSDPEDTAYVSWSEVRKFKDDLTVCHVNPESFSYLGLGAQLIALGNKITEDGDVVTAE